GVVDRGGLENRCTLAGTQGSNPCLSAKKELQALLAAFFVKAGMRTHGFVIAQRFGSAADKESLPFRKKKAASNACGFFL
ncbi:MAG: hypothetical protein K2L28_06460, partial [Muribaculaceae bacterium]|nr:hypothetical protein [Muribaculaceae bacterium]